MTGGNDLDHGRAGFKTHPSIRLLPGRRWKAASKRGLDRRAVYGPSREAVIGPAFTPGQGRRKPAVPQIGLSAAFTRLPRTEIRVRAAGCRQDPSLCGCPLEKVLGRRSGVCSYVRIACYGPNSVGIVGV